MCQQKRILLHIDNVSPDKANFQILRPQANQLQIPQYNSSQIASTMFSTMVNFEVLYSNKLQNISYRIQDLYLI
jgi:hypothetical protein